MVKSLRRQAHDLPRAPQRLTLARLVRQPEQDRREDIRRAALPELVLGVRRGGADGPGQRLRGRHDIGVVAIKDVQRVVSGRLETELFVGRRELVPRVEDMDGLTQLLLADVGGDGGVLALGVDHKGGAAVADQGRDNHPRPFARPRAGDNQGVMFRGRADRAAGRANRCCLPARLTALAEEDSLREAVLVLDIDLHRRVVRRAVDRGRARCGRRAGAEDQVDHKERRHAGEEGHPVRGVVDDGYQTPQAHDQNRGVAQPATPAGDQAPFERATAGEQGEQNEHAEHAEKIQVAWEGFGRLRSLI